MKTLLSMSINWFELMQEVKDLLPLWLEKEQWNSLLVDYHPPIVKRLWLPYKDYRVSLHEIDECSEKDALWHSHPWPSIIEVLEGSYRMDLGHSTTSEAPKDIVCKQIITKGCQYVMDDPNGWHFVSPLTKTSYSIMITGKPWKNSAPKPSKILKELSKKDEERLITKFKSMLS